MPLACNGLSTPSIGFAGLLLTSGAIGDRVLRKRILQLGLLIFVFFSLGTALSSSTGMLINMRAFMGVGDTMILPSTLSILTSTFPDNKERAQAIAILGGYVCPRHGYWSAYWRLVAG